FSAWPKLEEEYHPSGRISKMDAPSLFLLRNYRNSHCCIDYLITYLSSDRIQYEEFHYTPDDSPRRLVYRRSFQERVQTTPLFSCTFFSC
ncbi:hypothetical protein PMAYCL1PPCAC_31428, partial [Pristionchus mayeri]